MKSCPDHLSFGNQKRFGAQSYGSLKIAFVLARLDHVASFIIGCSKI